LAKYNLGQFLYKFKPDILEVAKFREIATRKGWTTNLSGPLVPQVERDILTFDSFSAIAELSDDRLQFGGGTLLNWVYARSSPRFSFDIDSQILRPKVTKEEILRDVIQDVNDRLRKAGNIIKIPFAEKSIEVGSIEYDKEKDHFPDVLSLKRRVLALTVGQEAHRYIRKELHLTDDMSREGSKLKEHFGGFMPLIEEVRLEIGSPASEEHVFPRRKTEIRPLVYPEAPVEPVKAAVTRRST
jgi:nucleotidyltransferase AbiEii toxin of type IV toxin-antitoxin system